MGAVQKKNLCGYVRSGVRGRGAKPLSATKMKVVVWQEFTARARSSEHPLLGRQSYTKAQRLRQVSK